MRGDAHVVPVRLVASGGHFFFVQLREAGNRALGQHAARGDQLYTVRARFALLAYGFARIPRAVNLASDEPAVSPRHAQHETGGGDARAGNPSLVHGVANENRDGFGAAGLANRRTARRLVNRPQRTVFEP